MESTRLVRTDDTLLVEVKEPRDGGELDRAKRLGQSLPLLIDTAIEEVIEAGRLG